MERCKRDSASMNNQGVVNEDRISELPEALILLILSRIPTKVAISTSVLSKKWQSLWKMLPKLKFDSYLSYNHSRELGTFSKNLRKALLSHKALVLESLHLKIHLDRCNAMDTAEILIGIAFARNVRKLVLEVEPPERFIFPKSLYNCETLETLKVKLSVLMDVPSSVCLKSLRTLHLHDVDFKGSESVLNLLSGCPNLENLDVHGTLCYGKLTIAIPSLQRLSICDRNGIRHVGYVINAPSLKYLKIIWSGGRGSCFIENTPMLLEASIIINNDTSFILGSLTSVKRLSLEISAFEIPFPTSIIFHQLVYLELRMYRAKDLWNLLTLMLDTCPNLQVLELISPQPWKKRLYGVPLGKWDQPNNVPQCLLFHLKTFVWKDFEWQENEKEVTKYILSNASRLEKATFFRKRLTSKERVEMVDELETVIKSSSSCQLLFK